MNTCSALAMIIMLTVGSNFDLQSYTNHEMKIYKQSEIEKIEPSPELSEEPQIFKEWNIIIQKHSRDKFYKHLQKKKK
jgi:hypothetical protein